MINISKCIKSFSFAFKGIYRLFRNENNARVHLLASLIAVGCSFYFNISREEWLWILLAIALVWAAEAFNTAIEKIVDFISPGLHPRAGEIKDLAAGAVLITALFALLTGLIIFIPKIF